MSDKSQLSPEEIDKLFRFVERKRVRYRDVQYEIVDHLATAIEELQQKNPEVSFDKALTDVYARFPVTGFANWVYAKQEEMRKYWSERTREWILQYFKLPEIAITLGLAFIIYTILHFTGSVGVVISLIIAWLLAGAAKLKAPFKFRFKNKTFNNYLVVQSFFSAVPMALSQSFGIIASLIGLFHNARIELVLNSWYFNLSLSIVLAVHCIIVYATNFVFPYWLEEEIEQKYSHLNIPLS